MMMVDGRNDVLVIDLKDGLMFVVDKCANDDFVYFESVVVVCLLP